MASPKNLDFVVTGDSVRAKATAEQALVARKFRVTWQDDWAGLAERGRRSATWWPGRPPSTSRWGCGS